MEFNEKKDELLAHIDRILRRRVFVRTDKNDATYLYTSTVKVVYGKKELTIVGEIADVNPELSIQDQINTLIRGVLANHNKEVHHAITEESRD